MKNLFAISMLLLLFSCTTTTNTNNKDATQKKETPRRTFELVDTEEKKINDLFIVNSDYEKSEYKPSRYSMILAASSFMSELKIINDLDIDGKISFCKMFFQNLPEQNNIKEIIIPKLNKEQDAYFFITPFVSKDDIPMYQVETNIPIYSMTDKNFRSYYKLNLDSDYFKSEVPARWVGVMFFKMNKDKIFYQGIYYPNYCSPLVVSGNGIGPDKYFEKLLEENSDVDKIKTKLLETTGKLFETYANETDEKKVESINRLKKYTNVSLAFYSFLQGKIDDSKDYLDKSKSIELNTNDQTRILNLTEVIFNAIKIDQALKMKN